MVLEFKLLNITLFFDIIINYLLFQKFKYLENNKFNHLTMILPSTSKFFFSLSINSIIGIHSLQYVKTYLFPLIFLTYFIFFLFSTFCTMFIFLLYSIFNLSFRQSTKRVHDLASIIVHLTFTCKNPILYIHLTSLAMLEFFSLNLKSKRYFFILSAYVFKYIFQQRTQSFLYLISFKHYFCFFFS